MKRYLLYLFLLSSISSFSQKLSVSGNIQDTSAKGPLPNAIIMAIKLMDSTLVGFARSDENGFFYFIPFIPIYNKPLMKLIILNVFVAEARTARKLVEQIWQSGQFGPTSGTLENFINLF